MSHWNCAMKVREICTSGGFGVSLAKAVVAAMCRADQWENKGGEGGTDYDSQGAKAIVYPDLVSQFSDTFDPSRISVCLPDSSLGKAIEAYIGGMGGWPADTIHNLSKWMGKHNGKWGCLGIPPASKANLGDEMPMKEWDNATQQDPSVGAWVSCIMNMKYRLPPAGFSCVGQGSFTKSTSDVIYILINMATVLKQGVGLSNITKFIENYGADELFDAEDSLSCIFKVAKNTTLWIPPGYLTIPVCHCYDK